MWNRVLIVGVLVITSGCENPLKKAVRNVEYSGYEMIGIQKRDLLKRHITQTREDEKEAARTFGDALEKLRQLYGLPDSELSRNYKKLNSAYEDSRDKAENARQSRVKMETTAKDLFREWESESEEIQDPKMRASSQAKLRESRASFQKLGQSLAAAEKRMDPVLARLKDHVLYLKHNLNAESLAGLKKEHDRVSSDIESLIKEMNRSIAQADEFIKTIK